MSGKKLQYRSIEELNAQVTLVKNASVPNLLKSAPKLISAAQEAEKNEDLEVAYIYFMKFMQITTQIRKSKEYKVDKKFYDAMISNKHVNLALNRCEALSASLEDRYNFAKESNIAKVNGSNRKVTPPIKPIEPTKPVEKPAQPSSNGLSKLDREVTYIDPINLLNLIKERATTFLVLDVRDSADFKASHVDHVNVLNIPGETLQAGTTAKSIERSLHIEFRGQWLRRGSVDRLILMDWTTEKLPETPTNHCKLSILKDALLKWDIEAAKVRLPLYIVKGGFENYGMQYPMYTTGPKKVTAPSKKSGTESMNKLMCYTSIEYPDLDTGFIGSPSPASSANTSLEPITNGRSYTPKGPPINSNGPLYPSTAEVTKFQAIQSGALIVSKEPVKNYVSEVKPASQPPLLPDRSTKPLRPQPKISDYSKINLDDQGDAFNVTKLSESLSSTITSTNSEMNNAMIDNSDVSNITTSEYDSVPNVDRSLKAKALIRMGEVTTNKMTDVLEAEKDLIEETLQLEKKQLEMENRWEVFRLRREKSAEEDMKLEVMKKEEALLLELDLMKEDKLKKDEENDKLRQQLNEMKAKMEKETAHRYRMEAEKESQKQAEAKNAQLEAEMRKLKLEVERKRRLRIEQQKNREIAAKNAAENAATQARIEEAARKRKELDREVEEKERQKQIWATTKPPTITKVGLKKDSSEESDIEPKSSLNRSHSSPNIAQMFDDDNVYTNINVLNKNNLNNKMSKPVFNRTTKPSSLEISQARSRDFQPIWSTNKKGLTGLRNLGNTCYMNSILQCLSNFHLLANFFVEKLYVDQINKNSETGGEIAIEFGEVVKALCSNQYKSISPVDFKRAIGKYKENFRGHDQQDAHELLVTLMEWLHNDINEVKTRVTLPEQKNEGISDREAAQRAWEMENKADRSYIRELFYGQWRSSLTCQTCNWASVKYESFFELALPLPAGHSGKFTLQHCIENFLKPEMVSYTCPKCKSGRECRKKFDIVKLPKILTVQLVRFYNDGLWRKKQNFIDFDLKDMNFGQYATACNGELKKYTNYNLFAVCNHFGSMEGGHYTAYCLAPKLQKWYKYDDHEVTEMNDRDVITSAAYVLFYTT